MNKGFRRVLLLFTTYALIVAAFVPISLVRPAYAMSKTLVDRVVNVKTDENAVKVDNFISIINNTNDNWTVSNYSTGVYFELILPEGVDWADTSDLHGTGSSVIDALYDNNLWDGVAKAVGTNVQPVGIVSADTKVMLNRVTNKTVAVTITPGIADGATNGVNKNCGIKIPLAVKWDCPASGDVKVTIDNRNGVLTAGSYTFAVAGEGGTITSIDTLEKFSGRDVSLGTIRIDETCGGSILSGSIIKLILPVNFSWTAAGNLRGGAAFAGKNVTSACNTSNSRELDISFNDTSAGSNIRGELCLIGAKVHADNNAPKGDVIVAVAKSSSDLTDSYITEQDFIVARLDASKSVASITGNNILLVGDYAFDLSMPASASGYNVNNFVKAAKTVYEVDGKNCVYYKFNGHWYDIIADENMVRPISDGNVAKINGSGVYQYMNMQ